MGENTAIEWATHTFNPWVGCTKVSAACDHCYAESWAKRTGSPELWTGERRRTSVANWRKPWKWDEAARLAGERHRVFCASLADVFDNQVPSYWRADLWELIRSTPCLDWLLLTKRPQNIKKMLGPNWASDGWPNVWLGTTVENQEEADRRIPHLLAVPAAVRFLSVEPMLGPVDLMSVRYRDEDAEVRINALTAEAWVENSASPSAYTNDNDGNTKLDWVICGGESGPKARPMHPDWARSLRDQCCAAGVAFFYKQTGEYIWVPAHGARSDLEPRRVGKKSAGRLLDGRTWDEMPARAA